MPYFRMVKEAHGGAVEIRDDFIPLIGTYRCTTCVALCFKLDDLRCFFGHLCALSALTWRTNNAVTAAAGEKIRAQVFRRLCDFSDWENWDVKNDNFGTHVSLLCPRLRDPSGQYTFAGTYVVQAIRDFFEHCARVVEDELRRRGEAAAQNTPVPGGPHLAETVRLTEKAIFLRHQATYVQVKGLHHGIIIDPVTNRCWYIGEMWEGVKARKEDLGAWRPGKNPLPRDNCLFGVEKDDVNAFPREWHSSDEERQEAVSLLRRARAEYASDLGRSRSPSLREPDDD